MICLSEDSGRQKKKEKENMKKFLALMLALCLALATIPVLAENDLTGTWYLISMGLTGGTMEMKADGTCTFLVKEGEEGTAEGTWTADGNNVTLDQTMELTFDGTDLILSPEALATFAGADTMGLDPSLLSSFVKFSREPGKVTAEEFNAYQADGTVPEGKTKEDMDAIQTEIMLLAFSMMGGLNADDLGNAIGGDTAPAVNPEVTVLEDNFYVRSGFGENSLEGLYIAKVQNQNDAPLTVSEATLILKDAEGNEVGRKEYMGSCGSRYLEPGEISFVSLTADVDEGATPDTYEITFQTSGSSYSTDIQIEAVNPEVRISDNGYWVSYNAAATITNATEEPVSQVNVVIAVKDSNGKLLDLGNAGLYQNELAPGSTITVIDTLDSRTVDYIQANNLELGQAEAYGWKDSTY